MNADRAIQIMNKMAAIRRSQDINDEQKALLLSSLKTQLDAATGQGSLEAVAQASHASTKAAK